MHLEQSKHLERFRPTLYRLGMNLCPLIGFLFVVTLFFGTLRQFDSLPGTCFY